MKPIRQLATNFTFLQPQRLSATSAVQTLRSLALQARQAVRQHLLKRNPGTPAPTPTMELNDAQSGPGPEVYRDWLTSIKGNTQSAVQPASWEAAYDAYYADTGTASVPQVQAPAPEVRAQNPEDPVSWESAYDAYYADTGTANAPQIQPPAPEVRAQLDGIVDAHEGVTKAMTSAGQNPAFGPPRARDMVKALHQATEAIAAIRNLKADAADAQTAHLQAVKGYADKLTAAYRHAVVLSADLLDKGRSDKALEPLIAKLGAQQKALAAYIRLLEA